MSELPESPAVSVILCTYALEMFEHFQDAADSVLEQTYSNVELVVVVDGNHEVFERVHSEYGDQESVVIREMPVNKGLLVSRNKGVEIASGDIVAFIDDDAVADKHWISELVGMYDETDAMAAGGRMVPMWVGGKPDFLPAEFYWLVGVTHRGFPEQPTEVRNTFGSNLSLRREVFRSLGGFDTEIGGRKGDENLQGGETELCARLQAEYGEGVMYNPDAIVAHKVFEYRTRLRWQLNRAFWQGYSKRAMQTMVDRSGGEESQFFKRLLFDFVPSRIVGLLTRPSFQSVKQLLTLAVLTGTVGAGYLYGFAKW